MDDPADESGAGPDEAAALRRRIAALETQVAEHTRSVASLREELTERNKLLDELPVMVFLKDREGRYLFINRMFSESFGRRPEDLIGKTDFEIFPPETARVYHANDESIMAGGEPRRNVELYGDHGEGIEQWTLENHIPLRDASGRVTGLLSVLIDITDRKRAEESLRQTEAELRAALRQKEQLHEVILLLSTPLLPLAPGILVLPLIGQLDAARSDQLMEVLLAGVTRHGAELVILDLTGVPHLDAAVADRLVRATRAVGLLGARALLVGISSRAAQTLAELGVELRGLTPLGDLRAGIRHALALRGQEIRSIAG